MSMATDNIGVNVVVSKQQFDSASIATAHHSSIQRQQMFEHNTTPFNSPFARGGLFLTRLSDTQR